MLQTYDSLTFRIQTNYIFLQVGYKRIIYTEPEIKEDQCGRIDMGVIRFGIRNSRHQERT